ncbi:MAG: type II toxin-antitoxin system Phd/YefM family antitoxin [Acidimicrobiia bacterium]|nr:type II toxin-antitoxin system Phd/YefM family antitoxin [Acidimicrobiia bacterium]
MANIVAMSAHHIEVVNLGEFRNRAAELIRVVEESGRPLVIARRGRPVAELRPVVARTRRSREGSVTFAPGVDLTTPVIDADEWEAER